MAFVIAFSGKGGTGKTTLAALTIRYLIERGESPVLAVDADPNSCLDRALGVPLSTTIGALREDALRIIRSGERRPGGMATEQMLEYGIQQALVESKGFDLLVMGRPEGPGCYCAANTIIRKCVDQLAANYRFVVIDNEAGMEHLSRGTTHKVNVLFIVSNPTVSGIETVKRITQLIEELRIDVGRTAVILNRVSEQNVPDLMSRAVGGGLSVAGSIPYDPEIEMLDREGKPIFRMSTRSVAYREFSKLLESLEFP